MTEFEKGFRIVEVGPAKVTYTVSDGYLKIDMLKVPAEARGQGAASKAVDFVLSEADKNGLTVHLTPDPVGTGGMSKTQLEAFYKSRGFTPNTGGTKDFSVMSSMIREPRPSETQSSKLLAGVSGVMGLGTLSAGATLQRDETPKPKN